MIWIIYLPLMFLVMLICYVTNPIVALFADKNGELKGFWHYWQTWDDSLDSKFMMTEVIPDKYKKLDYGYNDKYIFSQDKETLKEYEAVIDKSTLKDGVELTTKEKFQRYLCRVLWITRNCAYGFAYYIFSAKGNVKDIQYKTNTSDNEGNYFYLASDDSQNILIRPWTCKFYKHFIGPIYVMGYLGWKMPVWRNSGKYRSMIANRIAFRLHPNNGE